MAAQHEDRDQTHSQSDQASDSEVHRQTLLAREPAVALGELGLEGLRRPARVASHGAHVVVHKGFVRPLEVGGPVSRVGVVGWRWHVGSRFKAFLDVRHDCRGLECALRMSIVSPEVFVRSPVYFVERSCKPVARRQYTVTL